MKSIPVYIAALAALIITSGCQESGTIALENSIRGAVIKNVRWGKLYLANSLVPGESSGTIRVYDNTAFIDLPEENPVQFYMEVNGDLIYLETKESYRLNIDENLEIVIDDSTAVHNSLIDD